MAASIMIFPKQVVKEDVISMPVDTTAYKSTSVATKTTGGNDVEAFLSSKADRFAKEERMEIVVQWAMAMADDSSHGYSQGAENATESYPYTGSREGPDYDCASLIYHALNHAGFAIIEAWQHNPDYYRLYNGRQETGDADTIWPDLQKIGGFSRYSWENVEQDLKRGDILCRPDTHVAIYIGDGRTVEARGVNNPRGGSWKTGDQGGELITIMHMDVTGQKFIVIRGNERGRKIWKENV